MKQGTQHGGEKKKTRFWHARSAPLCSNSRSPPTTRLPKTKQTWSNHTLIRTFELLLGCWLTPALFFFFQRWAAQKHLPSTQHLSEAINQLFVMFYQWILLQHEAFFPKDSKWFHNSDTPSSSHTHSLHHPKYTQTLPPFTRATSSPTWPPKIPQIILIRILSSFFSAVEFGWIWIEIPDNVTIVSCKARRLWLFNYWKEPQRGRLDH